MRRSCLWWRWRWRWRVARAGLERWPQRASRPHSAVAPARTQVSTLPPERDVGPTCRNRLADGSGDCAAHATRPSRGGALLTRRSLPLHTTQVRDAHRASSGAVTSAAGAGLARGRSGLGEGACDFEAGHGVHAHAADGRRPWPQSAQPAELLIAPWLPPATRRGQGAVGAPPVLDAGGRGCRCRCRCWSH